MTIAVAETPHQQWTGDGTTTAFSVTAFDVLSFEYIDVYVWDLAATSVAAERRHVDYQISGALTAPVITFATAPTNTYIVTAHRKTPIRQRTDYRQAVKFLADTHERPFDRLTNILAEIDFLKGRAFIADVGIQSQNSSLTFPGGGEYFNCIFMSVITGPPTGVVYPFSEVIWDEAGRQWIIKSGGRSGSVIEWNGCALIDTHRVVMTLALRCAASLTADSEYRFLAPGSCASYACCFGFGGLAVPGMREAGRPARPGGSTGGPTTDPTDPPDGTDVTIPGDPNWTPVRRCGDDTATGEYVKSTNITIVGTYFIQDGECFYVNPFDASILNQATAPGTEIATVQTSITGCADATNCGISSDDCASGDCTSESWDIWADGGAWCGSGPEPNRSYTISGFSDTMFAMTGSCDTGCTAKSDAKWDGVLTANEHSGPVSSWLAITGNPPADVSKSHNGRALGLSTKVVHSCDKWTLTIACSTGSGGFNSWVGTKAYGRTPGGVYTRTGGGAGGCALTPATVTLT